MAIALIHPFKDECYDPVALFDGCNKIGIYCRRLRQQSFRNPDRIEPNKYKGNGLEILVEAYLKLHPNDSRIGITDYEPVLSEDYGVDGIGRGQNGRVATVQVKYRNQIQDGNPVYMTANKDHLANFVANSFCKYLVNPADDKNMLIITTARGVHYKILGEMFCGKVKVIAYEDLRQMLDSNNLFWEAFREAFFRCKVVLKETKPVNLRQHQKDGVAAILAAFGGTI